MGHGFDWNRIFQEILTYAFTIIQKRASSQLRDSAHRFNSSTCDDQRVMIRPGGMRLSPNCKGDPEDCCLIFSGKSHEIC
jgi:hypothetical protein